MKIWIDAQLSPALAPWITNQFGVEALAVRDLGLRDVADNQIFWRARQEAAIVM
jgi:predicted nuclease of predicted toxin-antitoxin system